MYFSFFHGLFAIANQTEHDISCVNYDPTETHTHTLDVFPNVFRPFPVSCPPPRRSTYVCRAVEEIVPVWIPGRSGCTWGRSLLLDTDTDLRSGCTSDPLLQGDGSDTLKQKNKGKNNVYLLWITHILCRCRFHTCVLDIHTSFRLKRSQWKILFIYLLAFKVKF